MEIDGWDRRAFVVKAQDLYGYLWVDDSTVQVDKRHHVYIWREDKQKAHDTYSCTGPTNGIHTPSMTEEELADIPQIDWNT